MMKKHVLLVAAFVAVVFTTFAQETNENTLLLQRLQNKVDTQQTILTKLNYLTITGYIQSEWQSGEQSATLKVGTANTDASGNPIESPFNRFGIRRGRLRFTYDDGGIVSGSFLINMTDKATASATGSAGNTFSNIQMQEVFLTVTDPWFKTCYFRAGVFVSPFGNGISWSPSLLETSERPRVLSTLFPDDDDLGFMLALQPAKTSPFHFLKAQGGFFAGNGVNAQIDNRRDFIGQIFATDNIGKWATWEVGTSYCNGFVFQTDANVYTMSNNGFVLSSLASNKNAYATRRYNGFDGKVVLKSLLGTTQLRGEYIWGLQPGTQSSSTSSNHNALPAATDTYVRPFTGWYAAIVHDICKTPFSVVVQYDVYDPNTKVSGNEVGSLAGTTKTDLQYNTLGFGALWHVSRSLRLQAYYEFVNNETSTALASTNWASDYSHVLKANDFTVRLQYQF
jgi:hypothetical protein